MPAHRISGPTVAESLARRGVETGKPKARARPKSAKRSGMNRTESAFAQELELWKVAGRIAEWRYEAFKVRVTDRFDGGHNAVWMCPDFLVVLPDGYFHVYEVKGHEDEKDILRLKCAADIFPAEFFIVKKRPKREGGGFDIQPL